MKIEATFNLVAELAREHSRDVQLQNSQVHFVPIVVDDLKSVLPALEAFSRSSEGIIMYAAGDSFDAPFISSHDLARREAIQSELSSSSTGGSIDFEYFDVNEEYVDARVRGHHGTSELSAGESMALSVARVLMNIDLDRYPLSVVAYSATSLDALLAGALWRVGSNHFSKIKSEILKTLIFVVEAKIEVNLHCPEEGGFRFAIVGNRLLRRNTPDALGSDANQIAHHAESVAIFLGAGFSASSHLPIGNSLRDEAIKRLLGISPTTDVDSIELCRRFHEFAEGKSNLLLESERSMDAREFQSELTLEQVVYAESLYGQKYSTLEDFKRHHDEWLNDPGTAVLRLVEVIEADPQHYVIVEVNFDLLIETYLNVPFRVFATDEDFKTAANYVRDFLSGAEVEVPILKIHGTISEFESCIVQIDQTGMGLGLDKRTALEALITGESRMWIYVGASMRDKDLLPFLLGEECADVLDERWVAPFLDASVERFAESRQRKWRRKTRPTLQDRLITETADTFFGKLAEMYRI
ncbi:MAG: hypothetical protein WA860_06790 [Acidimicrobiales bacterium]